MAKFSEDTLDNWRKPPSQTEEQKIANAISMIKEAIREYDPLNGLKIEFVVQGSYASNTNVKLNSDIDICAMFTSPFYTEYRDGIAKESYGFTAAPDVLPGYRKSVIQALENKFGRENIKPGNKAIYIESNTYRVHSDVVCALQYRNYRVDVNNNPDNYVEGIKFFAGDGLEIINYPKTHVKNGIEKNNNTSRKYKRVVRLLKRIRNKMKEDEVPVSNNISSFLLEGLLWNVPNKIYNDSILWNDLVKQVIVYIYNTLKEDDGGESWGEVSEYFYLFNNMRKWQKSDVNPFLVQMWKYLEY